MFHARYLFEKEYKKRHGIPHPDFMERMRIKQGNAPRLPPHQPRTRKPITKKPAKSSANTTPARVTRSNATPKTLKKRGSEKFSHPVTGSVSDSVDPRLPEIIQIPQHEDQGELDMGQGPKNVKKAAKKMIHRMDNARNPVRRTRQRTVRAVLSEASRKQSSVRSRSIRSKARTIKMRQFNDDQSDDVSMGNSISDQAFSK